MALTPGTRLGPYEICAQIGVGGMGEVYQATDTQLKRQVAIKVLPDAVAADVERLLRFQREAEVLASLNHPNIAGIYGLEKSEGTTALVLELVEGPTLADRIAKGPVPLDEALPIARQIAEALEAAHEQGIIHRDLKPSNIKVRLDGTLKVLDFGLAKAMEPTGAMSSSHSMSPTITTPAMTQMGMILGTAAYMSPEQARGEHVDKRADIWAFGVVLYEMVTGKRLFEGKTVSDTLAAVLMKEPDLSEVPLKVRKLLRACLERDPKRRLRDIGEAWRLLEDGEEETNRVRKTRTPLLAWITAAVLGVFAAFAAVMMWAPWRVETERPLVRLDVDLGSDISLPLPETNALSTVAISPDGTRLAYLARPSGGPPRLFTRRLDQPKATELDGTIGANGPSFSRDGKWISFYAGGRFNKISVEGGAVLPLVDAPGFPGGASWWEDGNIIVAGIASQGPGAGGLARISSGGGSPTNVTDVKEDMGHVVPQYLPGGKAVLFTAYPTISGDKARVEVVTLADGQRKTIIPAGTSARYLPTANGSGHLVYANRGTLFAIPFDPDRLETRGTAVPILDDVAHQAASGNLQFDVSLDGTLVYRKGSAVASSLTTIQLLTPTPDGAPKKEPLRAKPGIYASPRFSADGSRLLMAVVEQGIRDVWVYDERRDTMTRLTVGGGPYTNPVWGPNSRYVFFSSFTDGMFWTRADGAGEPQPFDRSKIFQVPWSVTSDGKRLAYTQRAQTSQIWTVPLEETNGQLKAGKPERFVNSQFADTDPAFSPDGKWLAYTSNATGSIEVYVRAFPDTGARWQISNNGGTQAVWSPHGHDLLYQSGDQIMAVGYTAKGDAFIAEKPRVWLAKLGGTEWDLAPDGKRVAVVTPAETSEAPKPDHEVTFLLNFFDELRRRAPLK